MPNYGYGDGLAHGYMSAGDDIGKGITAAYLHSKKQSETVEGVQGLLDLARRMQYPDQKSGKVTNFFKDEQLQYIQRLIDQKKYHAAGQAEAAMGIGKDMYTRIQTAAAKQQAAYEKAQQNQKIMEQGIIYGRDAEGRPTRFDTKSNTWLPYPEKPTDAQGFTAPEQATRDQAQQRLVEEHAKNLNASQEAQFKAQKSVTEALRKGFDAQLNQLGIKSQLDLFNPSIQKGGTYNSNTGFVPPPSLAQGDVTETIPNTIGPKGAPRSQDSMAYYNALMRQDASGNAPAPITHIQFYSDPTAKKGSKDSPDQPMPAVLPLPDLIQAQNTAAALAGPNTLAALQFLRQNPDSEHADKVRKQLMEDLNKEPTPPQPNYAPDIVDPRQQIAAPTAPRAANLPPGQVPVTGGGASDTGDQSQVSEDAADQNPGY